MYIRRADMKVAKWGNSLAVRLPASLVQELNLKEGDEIDLRATGSKALQVSADESRQQFLERIRSLRFPIPPGYKFDREEANSRGPEPADLKKPGVAAD